MDKKILFLLSICQKAGFVVSGEERCEETISSKNGKLIIVAEDASNNTKKKFKNKSNYYNVPIFIKSTKEEISKAIGKTNRATIVITDISLANKIKSLM